MGDVVNIIVEVWILKNVVTYPPQYVATNSQRMLAVRDHVSSACEYCEAELAFSRPRCQTGLEKNEVNYA